MITLSCQFAHQGVSEPLQRSPAKLAIAHRHLLFGKLGAIRFGHGGGDYRTSENLDVDSEAFSWRLFSGGVPDRLAQTI